MTAQSTVKIKVNICATFETDMFSKRFLCRFTHFMNQILKLFLGINEITCIFSCAFLTFAKPTRKFQIINANVNAFFISCHVPFSL
jgi:hypothetical protein